MRGYDDDDGEYEDNDDDDGDAVNALISPNHWKI